MKLVFFSKTFKDKSIPDLVDAAHEFGFEGYDLCVRPGYAVNPENATSALPEAVKRLAADGFSVEMVTAPGDLVSPDHPWVEPLLGAMGESGIRLLKLGYAHFDPAREDYRQRVSEVRHALSLWEKLGERYGVKICYHTHSGMCLGLNCAALMHLVDGFDPKHIGAYIDPAHMLLNGEPFAFGVGMVREYLAIVALKDVLVSREPSGDEGKRRTRWVPAGEGCVPWSEVFAELARVGFDGPLTIHAEYQAETPEEHRAKLKPEVEYFRKKRDACAA